jgi:tRNA(adenine34) deaminase
MDEQGPLRCAPDERDGRYMAMALAEARQAAAQGEVPVGAVVVRPGQGGQADHILARAHNQPIGRHDPTAHAEILALRAAAAAQGNYRLEGCELYVTLEPCAMCAQALLHARLARVVYGAREPRTGADGSVLQVLRHPALNHQTAVLEGVEAYASAALMQAFFATRRAAARCRATPLRDDALRTPEALFAPLWAVYGHWRDASRHTQSGPALAGLRLHWLDVWPPHTPDPDRVTVALHGPDAWWPQWATWAQALEAQGQRVWLPDLVGHGMSDKPKKTHWHTVGRHAEVLAEWLHGQRWTHLHLVAHPAQSALAAALAARLPTDRVSVAHVEPAGSDQPANWRLLPYPDAGHRAAQRAWPWPP